MLPNFFIVGAPKCGTTSLSSYLQQHPDIFMCPIKEPNYFSFEDIEKQQLYYRFVHTRSLKEYEALFSGVENEKAIGEASVSYLYYPSVPQKIKNIVPEAKAVILLRNPVDRAFSHYLMDVRLGYVNISFDDIVARKSSHRMIDLYYQQYVSLGLYYDQVKRYYDIFGREKVAVIIFDDLKSNPVAVIKSLFSFLGVDDSYEPDASQKKNEFFMPNNKLIRILYRNYATRSVAKALLTKSVADWAKNNFFSRMKKPTLNDTARYLLSDIYRMDIERLEHLLSADLHAWYS